MLKSFGNNLLIVTVAMTPLLLCACGDEGDNSPQKFTGATARVVSIPATSAPANYQALLLGDK